MIFDLMQKEHRLWTENCLCKPAWSAESPALAQMACCWRGYVGGLELCKSDTGEKRCMSSKSFQVVLRIQESSSSRS